MAGLASSACLSLLPFDSRFGTVYIPRIINKCTMQACTVAARGQRGLGFKYSKREQNNVKGKKKKDKKKKSVGCVVCSCLVSCTYWVRTVSSIFTKKYCVFIWALFVCRVGSSSVNYLLMCILLLLYTAVNCLTMQFGISFRFFKQSM